GGGGRVLPGRRRGGGAPPPAEAGGPRAGHGLRPARRLHTPARHGGRRKSGAGHGAGGDRLRLGTGGRCGIRTRGGVDHRRGARSADLQSVLAGLAMPEGPEPSAEKIIRYRKDRKTRIATITFERPGYLNAPTIAARLRYADLLHRAGIDDDV